MFAEVVVHTPMARLLRSGEGMAEEPEALGMTFHYAVPAHLQGRVRPGHLVWVPFGQQQLHGVVLDLAEEPPEGVAVRPLDDLALDDPVLTPAQLALARWLSQTYLASILDCVLLMLPPGLAQKAEPVLALTPRCRELLAQEPPPTPAGAVQLALESADQAAAPSAVYFAQFPDLPHPDQHRLMDLLRRRAFVSVRTLERQAPALLRRSVVDPLVERGLVSRGRRIVEPPLRPKAAKQVALLADPATAAQVLPTLGRSSRQADVLAWLADHPMSTPTVAELCQAVGCSPAPVRSLVQRGWIAVDAAGRVSLALSPQEVADRLVELRGTETHRRVVDLLAAEAGPVWVGRVYAETDADLNTLRELAAAGLVRLEEAEVWRDPLAGKAFVPDRAPVLTDDQAQVWREVEAGLAGLAGGQEPAPTFLLHGVTGSGKTEIYLRAIQATLERGRQAIVLVPEIALTPQTVRRFAARFGSQVTVYHSDLSIGERYDVWRRARAGEVGVVVGTRSALFLPLPRLGLIVVDEEHDPSYKEALRSPRYHARSAALRLAQLTGAAVILGSATPSLETYYAAQLGHLRLLEMPRRIMGHARAIAQQQAQLHLAETVYRPLREESGQAAAEARFAELPKVQVVDLRQELRAGNRSILSRALQEALDQVLAAGQQAILFLNRRGSATFVICRDCGHVLTCPHCDVPLTYHMPAREGAPGALVCHHCGRRAVEPERCPECQSRRIRYLGAGTEKVAELVQTLWPAARVVRWDRDVTGRKGSHDALLEQFVNREAQVMVGTQMIAKGLDLPLVTLVGVISADVGLYLPDFRAAERSFQLLTQVAGRAGRSLLGGQVIIQSYRPEHYVIQAARRHDYLDFFRQELSYRRRLGYPPFRRLARLLYLHGDRERAKAEAQAMAEALRQAVQAQGLTGVDLIGPAPCFFSREGGQYRWQVLVCAADPVALLRTLEIPRGWRVDIDPVSVL
ncbi:MAG: primosomal protein N' [Caldilineales bacterium]|nr:primosomal protein N' [Caldilineales bacterium]